jgi:hypothetical protein
MAFKGSGVYNTITDQSQSAGSAGLSASCILPLLTHRGAQFETVTLANYQQKVGYDLAYNPGYLGLVTLLQTMSQVTVMRLNKDAYAGNVLLFQSGRYMSQSNLANPASVGASPFTYLAAGVTGTSSASTGAISVVGTAKSTVVYAPGTSTVWATDSAVSGTLVATAAGTAAGISGGTVTYGGTSTTVTVTFTGTKTVDVGFTPNEVVSLAVSANSAGNFGPLGIVHTAQPATVQAVNASTVSLGQAYVAGSLAIFNSGVQVGHDSAGTLVADNGSGLAGSVTNTAGIVATVSIASGGTGYSSGTVALPGGTGATVAITAVGGVITAASIVTGGSGYSAGTTAALPGGTGGTLSITVTSSALVTFTTQPVGALLTFTFIPSSVSVYALSVYSRASGSWVLLESQSYSLDPASSIYLPLLTWQNVVVQSFGAFSGSITFGSAQTPLTLANYSDGTQMLSTDVPTNLLASRSETFVVSNGLDISYQNLFLQYADANQKFRVLCDSPAWSTYDATASWRLGLFATNRGALYAVPDFVQTAVGSLKIWPSIKVMLAYASMYTKTGTLKYPVAGYVYGATTATSLLATDYAAHPADLKNSRINYIKIGSQGPVIWEERSLYGGESDLSYNYVTFILDDLSSTISSYMSNFVFRIISAYDLIRIQAGLDNILNAQKAAGFLWSAKASVPSFSQIQASGVRQATIPVTVQVAQDGEEWTINVVVSATAVS